MTNLSIKAKLMSLTAFALLTIVFLSIMSLYSMNIVTKESTEVADWWLEGIQECNEILNGTVKYRTAILMYINKPDSSLKNEMDKNVAFVKDTFTAYAKPEDPSLPPMADLDPEDRALFTECVNLFDTIQGYGDNAIKLADSGKSDDAYQMYTQGDSGQSYNKFIDAVLAMSKYNYNNSIKISMDTKKNESSTVTMSLVIALITIIGMVVIASLIIRSITAPVKSLISFSDRISQGDLSDTSRIAAKAELGKLSDNFANLADNLNGIVSEILQVAETVSTSAHEVTSTNGIISESSSAQADSIKEISVSLSEISEKIHENSSNATSCSSYTDNAISDAEDGSAKMDSMVIAMHEISEASKNIASIISTIDEIAFQTNILALNAAVEAAHAGNAGKGFTVVADEVRRLAVRSSTAAEDSTRLIADTIEKVNKGAEIAKSTSDALGRIVNDVMQVSGLIGVVESSTVEEAKLIRQISGAVDHVTQAVQHNASTTQETVELSQKLQEGADDLLGLTRRFKLKNKANMANKAIEA